MGDRVTTRRALYALVLFALWLLLSESLHPLHVATGLAAALVIVALNTRAPAAGAYRVRGWRAVLYVPWLLSRILLSGLHLSYLILHPRMPIEPKLFRHPTALGHEAGIVLLSNSITLTPGTITVEAGDDSVVVHAMDGKSAEDVLSDRLERQVAGVFAQREGRR